MSRYYADDDRLEVATTKEILFIFAIFAFILYILYPGEMQRKQVLTEKSNYELTAIYLESMLKLEPKNIDLTLAAARVSLENGNIDLANKLIGVLKKSPDINIQKQLYYLKYKLLKIEKSRSNNHEEIAKIDTEMAKEINDIAQNGLFRKEDARIWYRDAISLSQEEAALLFLKPLYEANDLYALKQCVYLAVQPRDQNERLYCVDKLSEMEGNRSSEWLAAAYIMHSEAGESEKAVAILIKLAKIDSSYRDELARVQQVAGNFRESSQIYLFLYENSIDQEAQQKYLCKSIRVLAEGGLGGEAVALAQKYEDLYLQDDEMMQRLIKLYLSADKLEAARLLSMKLLKREEK